jgi:recombination DNA repair RAD52 pathway protein
MSTDNQIITVTEQDLSLVEDNILNSKQLGHLLKRTPQKYVRQRPAKGGGVWSYVSGGYVKKVLNLMFGWDWDFEIIENTIAHGEVVVKGKLTCRVGDRTIVKMQYGNKDIMCKRGTNDPLSIGNDMKAAATDALKKCAAEIGIASDIYNADEFREVNVEQEDKEKELENIVEG